MKTHTEHMTPVEVVALLGVSRRTLSRWHAQRVGPARCKVGRTVLYRKSAIDAWLEKNETHPVRTFEEVAQ
jgi:excisionase family DNA binding protein